MTREAADWWHRARDGADWRTTMAWNELPYPDRQRIQRRVKAGLRSSDPRVRAVGLDIAETIGVATMDTDPASDHLRLEIAAAHWRGRREGAPVPLEDGEPVPGCGCVGCTGVPADHPARATRPRRSLDPALDIDAARSVRVTAVARRLGLDIDPSGKRARCPFHDDSRPSLDLRDDKGRAFCAPCGGSWDAIGLVREFRRCTFVEAVRELTGAEVAA